MPEQNDSADRDDSTDEQTTADTQRDLLRDVRKSAGWRVSPRHLDAAMQALEETGEEASIDRIAQVVSAFHGDGSNRQRRNADLWRLLGAQLAVRGKSADPEAQLAFIGRSRALSSENVTDSDLLLTATALGGADHPLTPELTAEVATWMIDMLGPEFSTDDLVDRLDRAVEAALAERSERANRRRRGRS